MDKETPCTIRALIPAARYGLRGGVWIGGAACGAARLGRRRKTGALIE